MSRDRDIAGLGKLVAATHGWPAAKAFKAYVPSDEDKAVIAKKAADVLRILPDMPGASPLMSAAFAAHLERDLTAPIHVVAGSLFVEGVPVFGDDGDLLPGEPTGWNGHAWVMVGPYVADISIFRTAYSRYGPAALVRHVSLTFGEGQGMYFDQWRHTRRLGLDYVPRCVLGDEDVTGLVAGAHKAIEASR